VAQSKMAAAARQKQTLDASVQIVGAWQHFRAAQERVTVANQALGQAEEAVRIIRNRYAAGLTTITEEIRAQTALLEARLNALAARSDSYIQYAALLRSAGRLTDVQPFL